MAIGANDAELGDNRKVHLFHAGERTPVVTFAHESLRIWDAVSFETQGRPYLAWSNTKGHIAVPEIYSRLQSISLAWPEAVEKSQ